jgi:hypothetical protein
LGLPETPLLKQLRADIARAAKDSKITGDHSKVIEARREYAAAKLEDFVRRTIAGAPPLSPEAAEQLAALLQGGDQDHA